MKSMIKTILRKNKSRVRVLRFNVYILARLKTCFLRAGIDYRLIFKSRFLEESALKCLVQATILASKARVNHGDASPTVSPRSTTSRPNSPKRDLNDMKSYSPVPLREMVNDSKIEVSSDLPVAFNSSAVFFLEVMISTCVQNRDRIGSIWPIVSDHIDSILSQASTCHPFLLERVISCVLRLMQRLSYNVRILRPLMCF
jgi:hypothetical protein